MKPARPTSPPDTAPPAADPAGAHHPPRLPRAGLLSTRLRWWILAWALLTVSTAALHKNVGRSGGDSGVIGTILKGIDNLLLMFTFPGWIASWQIGRFKGQPGWDSSLLGAAIGFALLLTGLALLLAIRRLATRPRHAPRHAPPHAPGPATGEPDSVDSASRRRIIVNAAFLAPAVLAPGATAYATIIEPFDLRITRYRVPIKNLPARLDGLRLVQISDTHYGPRVADSLIARTVRTALDLKPDLFLLTGDYVYDGPSYIDHAVELFRPLTQGPNARPTLGVLGNHDWYADGPRCTRELARIGVRMIDNARVYLDADARAIRDQGAPGQSLCIAGLGDLLEHYVDPHAALGGVHPDIPRLVLAHNPDTAEERRIKDAPRIDLMLSGHTHGGQCRFPLIGTPITLSHFGQKYNGGIADGPTCPVLVSRGIGTSILPVRFGVPPELVELTLVSV